MGLFNCNCRTGCTALGLIVSLVSGDESRRERGCICKALSILQLGALGTILTALVLLAVDFGGITTIGAIVYGAFFFFFIFLLASVICLARCYAECGES